MMSNAARWRALQNRARPRAAYEARSANRARQRTAYEARSESAPARGRPTKSPFGFAGARIPQKSAPPSSPLADDLRDRLTAQEAREPHGPARTTKR